MSMDKLTFDGVSVLVVGDVMLDEYWSSSCSRISPEAPVPVAKINKSKNIIKAGGAANVALNIAKLGAKVELVGLIGDDSDGSNLSKILIENKIKENLIISDSFQTIKKLRILSRNQQLIRIDYEESACKRDASLIKEKIKSIHLDFDIIIFSDYAKGMNVAADLLLKLANKKSIPVLIDPKGDDFSIYSGAYVITPNMKEFEQIVGEISSEDDIKLKAKELISELRIDALLITRSEHGMMLVQKSGECLNLPSNAKQVFDVTGAGDSVIATLAVALASNVDIEESCTMANSAAGIAVSKVGTYGVTLFELRAALQKDNNSLDTFSTHALSTHALKEQLDLHKEKGQKIVFTNGCFDILHSGHVTYLNEAKRLGDLLVVAINSDISVKSIKGPNRPINDLESRMKVINALSSVDYVCSFDELTPLNIISCISPDILVKGGDYKDQEIIGADIVTGYGGSVHVIDFIDGYSTTNTINKVISKINK